MNTTKPFAKKERQLKFLTKKIKRLLSNGEFYNMSFAARKKLIAKLQLLHQNLKRVLPTKRLQKIVAGASILLSVSLGNLHAQDFLPPVEDPFGLNGGLDFKIPALADIDGDGDLDLLTLTYDRNNGNGQLDFFENTGTAQVPAFASTPLVNPFGFAISADLNEIIWNFDLADMDNDGDLDLLLGAGFYENGSYNTEGTFFYYENTGTAQAPMFTAPVMDPFGLGRLEQIAFPSLVDLDGDGDLDVYATEYYSTGYFFENTGTAAAPAFAGAVMEPFGLDDLNGQGESFNFVEFGDIDGDGDLDVMSSIFAYSNSSYNYAFPFYYQENTGSATAPAFSAPDINNNPISFDNFSDSLGAFMSIADLDGDGDMDVLMNAVDYGDDEYFDHKWLYFENNSMVRTEELLNSANVQFFPNPTTDHVFIKSDSDLLLTDVRIFDITGRMVEQVKFNGSLVNVSHLASGVYLLKVYSEDEFVGGNKLVKK